MIPRIVRRALAAAIVLLAAGCGGAPERPAAAAPEPSAEAMARREAHRDALRERLGDAYDEPLGVALDDERRERAARLFVQLCAACHGDGGRGDGATAGTLAMPPADLTDPRIAELYSERATLEILREGVPGTPMIGWQGVVSDDDLVSLALYVRSLARDAGEAR